MHLLRLVSLEVNHVRGLDFASLTGVAHVIGRLCGHSTKVAVSCDYGEGVIRDSAPIMIRASVVNETDGILSSIYHVALQ